MSDTIKDKICAKLRSDYSPRHVPDKIYEIGDVPYTLTGKKMEIPVRKILAGIAVDKAANRSAMANLESLDFFINFSQTSKDYTLTGYRSF